MRFLTLPIVPITSTVRRAYDVMRSARRSAVVALSGASEYRLYSAARVVIAASENENTTLISLNPTEILHVPSRLDMLRTVAPGLPIEGRVLEQSLDSANRSIAILADVDNQALIATRHEPIADIYDPAPSACYCTVDDAAVAAPPGVNHGPCPNDPYHGNSVRCMGKPGGY